MKRLLHAPSYIGDILGWHETIGVAGTGPLARIYECNALRILHGGGSLLFHSVRFTTYYYDVHHSPRARTANHANNLGAIKTSSELEHASAWSLKPGASLTVEGIAADFRMPLDTAGTKLSGRNAPKVVSGRSASDKAWQFDGNQTASALRDFPSLSNPARFTISMWIKTTDKAGWNSIIGNMYNSKCSTGWGIWRHGSSKKRIRWRAGTVTLDSTIDFEFNTWCGTQATNSIIDGLLDLLISCRLVSASQAFSIHRG